MIGARAGPNPVPQRTAALQSLGGPGNLGGPRSLSWSFGAGVRDDAVRHFESWDGAAFQRLLTADAAYTFVVV